MILTETNEKALISDYLEGVTWKELCNKYSVNTCIIHNILKQNNIKANRDRGWSEEKKQMLKTMYLANATYPDMYKALNCKGGTLTYWVHKLNLPMRGSGRDNVFKNPFIQQSPERDYWLGYLFADGHISVNNGINLCSYELEPIEAFNNFTGNICSITNSKYLLKDGTVHTMYKATIVSRKMARWFMNYFNIESKKARSLDPNIEINWDIFRGYFDGDGWAGNIEKPGITLTSNSHIWISRLQEFLQKFNIYSNIYEYKDSCLKLCVYRKSELSKLVPLMYSNNTFKLERKFKRLEPFLSNEISKQGELLEACNGNQQPSLDGNIFEGSETNNRVLTDKAEDSNVDTSALPLNEGDDIVRPYTNDKYKN